MNSTTKQLLRQWDRAGDLADEAGDPSAENWISHFNKLADPWGADLLLPVNDDNPILRFRHPDHQDIYVHIYTGEDPCYRPMTIHPEDGIYSSQLNN